MKKWIGTHCERNTETKGNAKNAVKQSGLLRSRLVDGNAQMLREYAKNAFVGTWRRSSRCNACLARHGNRRMHSWQRPQATLFRICKLREDTKLCSACNTRKEQDKFSAAPRDTRRSAGYQPKSAHISKSPHKTAFLIFSSSMPDASTRPTQTKLVRSQSRQASLVMLHTARSPHVLTNVKPPRHEPVGSFGLTHPYCRACEPSET